MDEKDENQGSAAKSGIKFAGFSPMFNEAQIAGIWVGKKGWANQRSAVNGPDVDLQSEPRKYMFYSKKYLCESTNIF